MNLSVKSIVSLVGIAIVGVVLLVFCILFFKTETIKGNQIGVLETWGGGVSDEPLFPRTYVYIPGFMYSVFPYEISSQTLELEGNNAFTVQSKEGQTMTMEMSLRYRRDPEKIVHAHKTIGSDIDQKVVIPVLHRIAKDEGTKRLAIDAYSGDGLVTLQKSIQDALINNLDYENKGIIVENFVLKHIDLDPDYLAEIVKKQVASQRELRFKSEELAAKAEALKAKAEAQANYEKSVVEAERDKQVAILKSEQLAESQILAAEAEKKKQVLAAEGEKEAGILKSEAIVALGKATAEAEKMKMLAYSEKGSENYVRMEVAKSLSTAFTNIKGYLPSDMKINVLTESFHNSMKAVMGISTDE